MEVRRSVTDSTGIYLFSISGEELVVSNIVDTNNPYEVTRVPLMVYGQDSHNGRIPTDRRPEKAGWGYPSHDQNVTLRLANG